MNTAPRTRARPLAVVVSALALLPGAAQAYLDPATGSVILQGLIAGVAGVLLAGKLYWRKLKSLFARRPNSKVPATAATNDERRRVDDDGGRDDAAGA